MILISSEKYYWKHKFEIFFCFMGQKWNRLLFFFLNFGNICLIQVYLTLLFKKSYIYVH